MILYFSNCCFSVKLYLISNFKWKSVKRVKSKCCLVLISTNLLCYWLMTSAGSSLNDRTKQLLFSCTTNRQSHPNNSRVKSSNEQRVWIRPKGKTNQKTTIVLLSNIWTNCPPDTSNLRPDSSCVTLRSKYWICLALSCLCSEPLGFVRNLQVTDPTTSTLNVRWEPAEGSVREYIVIWTPVTGGEQDVVSLQLRSVDIMSPRQAPKFLTQVDLCWKLKNTWWQNRRQNSSFM